MNQSQVAAAFTEIADRLAASGEKNRFRLSTYKKLANYTLAMKDFETATVESISAQKGIGAAMAEKLISFRDDRPVKLLEELRTTTTIKERATRAQAEKVILPLVQKILNKFPKACVDIGGSFSRGAEAVKDGDILVSGDESPEIYAAFFKTLGKPINAMRVSIDGFEVDLRVVPLESRLVGLLWFQNPTDQVVKMRGAAKKKNMKLDQYALTERDTGKVISRDPDEIVRLLGV